MSKHKLLILRQYGWARSEVMIYVLSTWNWGKGSQNPDSESNSDQISFSCPLKKKKKKKPRFSKAGLWHSKWICSWRYLHPIMECWFKCWLLCLLSGFLIRYLGRQKTVAQVLGLCHPCYWPGWISWLCKYQPRLWESLGKWTRK